MLLHKMPSCMKNALKYSAEMKDRVKNLECVMEKQAGFI